MRTEVKDTIKIERIPGTKYVRLLADFHFFSVILGRWCCIPKGFIYDEESVPILRGTNPEAGAIHDFLCRFDSDPIVDKQTAANVYEEFQIFYNAMDRGWFDKIWDWIKEHIKTDAVRLAPGYFHKLPVMATVEEVERAA